MSAQRLVCLRHDAAKFLNMHVRWQRSMMFNRHTSPIESIQLFVLR
jgi:hypothetical protein